MIPVTHLNQSALVVNAELIELIEQTPDTVITLLSGRKLLVRESVEELVRRVIAYRQQVGLPGRVPATDNLDESR